MNLNLQKLEQQLNDAIENKIIKSFENKSQQNEYWEEIGKRCSVNTYNFWEDLKEQFKKEFILNKRQ